MDTPTIITAPSKCAVKWPQSVTEFEAVVDLFQHDLVRFAFCRLQNRADAEDAVQDVFLRIYRDRNKHPGGAPVVPFLYRMLANRCIDILRRRRRIEPVEDYAGTLAAADEVDRCAVQLKQIEDLLGGISSRNAEVMRLRIFSGLPFQTIAEIVGAALPTIKSRFRYGIDQLRELLTRR